ncbi:hypothetical protein HK13_00415 [Acetobacter indonesiensis]|jgi:hypothetical protein|nr:hypothetical protein HK13_00415 [Acetobacter indonesiensis]
MFINKGRIPLRPQANRQAERQHNFLAHHDSSLPLEHPWQGRKGGKTPCTTARTNMADPCLSNHYFAPNMVFGNSTYVILLRGMWFNRFKAVENAKTRYEKIPVSFCAEYAISFRQTLKRPFYTLAEGTP